MHNLSEVAKKVKKQHQKLSPILQDSIEVKAKLPRLMITPYFDLRCDKIEVVRNTPLCTNAMMFLNARGSLAHIVWTDDVFDPDYSDSVPHRREPIPKRHWGAHPEFVRRYVLKKLMLRGLI